MSEENKKRNLLQEGRGILDHRVSSGPVRGSVFLNPTERGQMYSVNIARNYQDKDGNWHSTNSFNSRDLPHVEAVARRAHDYCELNRGKEIYHEPEPDKPAKESLFKASQRKKGMEKSR